MGNECFVQFVMNGAVQAGIVTPDNQASVSAQMCVTAGLTLAAPGWRAWRLRWACGGCGGLAAAAGGAAAPAPLPGRSVPCVRPGLAPSCLLTPSFLPLPPPRAPSARRQGLWEKCAAAGGGGISEVRMLLEGDDGVQGGGEAAAALHLALKHLAAAATLPFPVAHWD